MKTILVQADKKFKIVVPDDVKITFGPWSPGKKDKTTAFDVGNNSSNGGTLRIYDSKGNILCCFAHVTSFRDLSLDYSEQVVVEEGATIWNSDQTGYKREHKQAARSEWVNEQRQISNGKTTKAKPTK
jgi:hypothetical protein